MLQRSLRECVCSCTCAALCPSGGWGTSAPPHPAQLTRRKTAACWARRPKTSAKRSGAASSRDKQAARTAEGGTIAWCFSNAKTMIRRPFSANVDCCSSSCSAPPGTRLRAAFSEHMSRQWPPRSTSRRQHPHLRAMRHLEGMSTSRFGCPNQVRRTTTGGGCCEGSNSVQAVMATLAGADVPAWTVATQERHVALAVLCLSLLQWNPGTARGRSTQILPAICGSFHAIMLQEAHEHTPNKFHPYTDGDGLAILLSSDMFFPDPPPSRSALSTINVVAKNAAQTCPCSSASTHT